MLQTGVDEESLMSQLHCLRAVKVAIDGEVLWALVDQLQIALRDSANNGVTSRIAREFVESARDDEFKGFPAIQLLIDRGWRTAGEGEANEV